MVSVNPDILRFAFFAVFGLGAAFMLATNVIAYKVLRPPQHLGFLWWHVTAISISFLCFGAVVLSKSYENLGKDDLVEADWSTYVTALGVLTYTIAQVIIFQVERSRLTQKVAAARKHQDVLYDPVIEEAVVRPEADDVT